MTTIVTIQVTGHQVMGDLKSITQGEEGHNITQEEFLLEEQGQVRIICLGQGQVLSINELSSLATTAVSGINTGGNARDVTKAELDGLTKQS